MKRLNLHIAVLLLVVFGMSFDYASGKNKEAVPYLEARVDRRNVVVGERLIYEVVLFSPHSSIAGVEIVASPGLSILPSTPSSPDSQFSEIEVDGMKYYTAVIDRYFIGINEKGKYNLTGGEYRIGVGHRVQVNDPFWGPTIRNRIEAINLKAPDLTIKATALPSKDRPHNFSGAVGEFEVTAYLPEGNLRAGEDVDLIVSIAGYGDLTYATLPEVRKMLPEGIKFKSMTDSRSHYVKDGRLGSEIEIECVITPDREGEFIIDGIEFVYFDTKNGKYTTAKVPGLKMMVGEGIPSDSSPPVIIDV